MESKGVSTTECYDFYRQHKSKDEIQTYRHYRSVVNTIFAKIYDVYMNSKGGVYIEGFGYFCRVRKIKEKQYLIEKENSLFKTKVIKKNYISHFEPDKMIKDWSMSGTHTRPLVDVDIDYKLNFGACNNERKSINRIKKKKNAKTVRVYRRNTK